MSNILILVDHKENRRLLAESLAPHHTIILPENPDSLNDAFDVGIVDGQALNRLWQQVKARKESEEPLFLPILFMTTRHDVGMITRNLWQNIDELIFAPIERAELLVRVEVLARARRLSLELEASNNDLQQEMRARYETEKALSRSLTAEQQARQDAEKANRVKLTFLAMISHELRTPLTAIKGFASTLLSADVSWDADTQRDFVQIIDAEADKMTDLVEHLLDLARLEAGTMKIEQRVQPFHSVLEVALPQLNVLTANHLLTVDLPPDLPPLRVDARRVAQVLVNLVGNATKFSPPGSRIILSAHSRNGYVQVNISDEGPGIPPEELPHIFQAFQQLRNSKGSNSTGMGLGLAICKGLVTAHGGDIWVENRQPSGATFAFTLPTAVSANVAL